MRKTLTTSTLSLALLLVGTAAHAVDFNFSGSTDSGPLSASAFNAATCGRWLAIWRPSTTLSKKAATARKILGNTVPITRCCLISEPRMTFDIC